MKQVCASFEDFTYKEILKLKNDLAISQTSKVVTYMVTAYLQGLAPLQKENKELKEQLGFLRSEFDKIHTGLQEIKEPLKLLTAGSATAEPQPQVGSRSFVDKLLRRNKSPL